MKASTADILILEAFDKVLGTIFPNPAHVDINLSFPKFPYDVVSSLIELATTRFRKQSTLINLPLGTYIVGDIHGNIHDLLRILGSIGDFTRPNSKSTDNRLPQTSNSLENTEIDLSKSTNPTKILFLGDYVDRGEYSIESIILLFALTVAYPDNVFLLRGNHEFMETNEYYGFKAEIENEYGKDSDLYYQFNMAFNYLPITAIVGETNFCVHGGLSSKLSMISQIESFQRPLNNCQNLLLMDLMWSDPTDETLTFKASNRGGGCFFGQQATEAFLRSNNFTRLFRAHQCCQQGVDTFFNKLGYTVFSTSNYEFNNLAGYVKVNLKNKVVVFTVPITNDKHNRARTTFVPVLDEVRMNFSNRSQLNYFTYNFTEPFTENNSRNLNNGHTVLKQLLPTNLLPIPRSISANSATAMSHLKSKSGLFYNSHSNSTIISSHSRSPSAQRQMPSIKRPILLPPNPFSTSKLDSQIARPRRKSLCSTKQSFPLF